MKRLCYIGKVLSIACMVQSAVLFPLARKQAQWFQHTTLSIFIITTVAFSAANTQLLVEVGLYTVPAALILLVLAVMQLGSQSQELLPWLPSFVAAVNIITLATGKIIKHRKARRRPSSLEDGLRGMPFGTLSDRSSPERTSSAGLSTRQPSESAPHGPEMFGQYGPSSRCSHRDSDMSLSDGSGRCRSAWDSVTRSFWADCGNLPASSSASGPLISAGLAAIHGFDIPDMDLVWEAPTTSSRHPLLGEESDS
ncbi:hypothetical protein QBC39DRAFT_251739 [Podospora conica]|nr:hypothetical protein QBC39DRAFT_251739 [Schizothecium conicum]